MKKSLSTTKDVIYHTLPYVSGRVLDLGAGMAKYKPILNQKALEYIACDARKNKNIDVVCDAENLFFAPEYFDTVVSTQVFEHIKNPFQAAGEIKKVLKSGGYAIITAPFMVPVHADPVDNFRFSKEGLVTVFERLDFEIVESDIYGGFFMVMCETLRVLRPAIFANIFQKIAKIADEIFPYEKIYANSFIVARKK